MIVPPVAEHSAMNVGKFTILRDAPVAACSNLPVGVREWRYRSAADGCEDWALLWPAEHRHSAWAVVLHGHGSAGDQVFKRADLRECWLPALRRNDIGILAPNLRGNAWMSPAAAADLHALLAAVRAQYDVRHFIITGGSMGGTGALAYSVVHPGDVAGCVACCPATDLARYATWCKANVNRSAVVEQILQAITAAYGGEPDKQPEAYARHSACAQAHRLTMPVAIAHAAGDPLIPVDQPRELIKRLANRGVVRYDEQPAGNHDSSLALYPSLLEWVINRIS